MTGFELNIFGWYGAGAGLHLLQLLSDGAYAYAVADNNLSPCTAGLGASNQSGVATTGTWNETSVVSEIAGTYQSVLVAYVEGGIDVANAPTITWTPYVAQGGAYEIYLETPGCRAQATCPERTSVSVVVTPSGDGTGTSTTTTVDQTNTADSSTLIYSGNLLATTSSEPAVTITMGLASGGAATSGTRYGMVAEMVSLVAASTNGTTNATAQLVPGYGLFEFALVGTGAFGDAVAAASSLNASATLTNATGLDEVSFKLSRGAIVNSVISIGSGADTRVFLGGDFTYTDNATSTTSTNVISYSSDLVTVAPNGGLAGAVSSLIELNGVLYAAGTFVATSDGTVTGLDGAAKWEWGAAGSTWVALGTVPSVGGTIAALGVANTGTNDSVVAVGGGGNGLAFYDPATSSWNASQTGFLVGNLTAFGGAASISNSNGTVYFAGNVVAVSSNAAPGGALLSRNSHGSPKLTSFGYQLESAPPISARGSSSTTSSGLGQRSTMMVVARALANELVAALGPRSPRTLEARAPAASVNITLPSAISLSSSAQVLAGAFWKNGSTTYMLLGGSFATSDGVQNVGLYRTADKTLVALAGETLVGAVTALAVFGDTAWIGGNFSSVSGRQGFTTYDLKQGAVDGSEPALTGSFCFLGDRE
jgi:hypothetical protein